eukprot:m51a1_g8451 hypothetical protein (404) ;mRNA; f:401285-402563
MTDPFAAYAHYVVDSARRVVESCGPRAPGSPEEASAAEFVRSELASLRQLRQPPVVERFDVHPASFYGYMPYSAALALASMALYWLSCPVLSWICGVAAFVPGLFITLMYSTVFDPLFPRRTSQNVVAEFVPAGCTGVPRRTIIVSGHVDSAWRWRYVSRGPVPTVLFGASGLVSLVWCCVATLPLWSLPAWVAALAHLVLVPGTIGWSLFVDSSTVVPGANDNLSGTFAAVAVARMVSDGFLALSNARLVVLATGSEEAGLRGAKAYAAAHARQLASEGEVAFVALETLRDRPDLAVMHGDLHNFVRCDSRLCAHAHAAASEAGVRVDARGVWFGASDSAAFAQAGVPSVCIAAMDPSPARYYHTLADTPDNMDQDCVRDALKIVAGLVRRFDERGLEPASA